MRFPTTALLALLPVLAATHPLTVLLSNETTPALLPIYPPTDPTLPDPNYNTSYPGPVRAHEWNYYHTQYSPDWFHANCDAITGTSCLCSTDRKGGAYNQIASYTQWAYHSRFHNKTYTMEKLCGPVALATNHHENHCWKPAQGKWCAFNEADGQEICMDWSTEGKKWITFHGHKRYFDHEGIYTWVPERVEEMPQDVCEAKCKDLFLMDMFVGDDEAKWGSFIGTWFPPKPIPWGKGN